jgi:hypothetical protein
MYILSAKGDQIVTNWYDITTPETTPKPNETAKIFTQNLYICLKLMLDVKSHSISSTAKKLAKPMLSAGKIM